MPYVYLCLFLWSENVWDFTKIEDVVDVLQEQLILELVVVEEEYLMMMVRMLLKMMMAMMMMMS